MFNFAPIVKSEEPGNSGNSKWPRAMEGPRESLSELLYLFTKDWT